MEFIIEIYENTCGRDLHMNEIERILKQRKMFMFIFMLKCLQYFDFIFIIKMLGTALLSIAVVCIVRILCFLTDPQK